MDTGLTYVNGTIGSSRPTAHNTGHCSAATLAVGSSVVVQFDLRVNDATPAGTVISNQAVIYSAEIPNLLTDGDGNRRELPSVDHAGQHPPHVGVEDGVAPRLFGFLAVAAGAITVNVQTPCPSGLVLWVTRL